LNRVRIIGGAWRSRVLRFPDADGLRPTPDRVRETLFNWLGQNLAGLVCLDLFAGSGALGFEAASRHAAGVVMIERDREAFAGLQTNAELLEPDAGNTASKRLHLTCADALEWIGAPQRAQEPRYDIVFLDPPYQSGLLTKVLPHLARVLKPGAKVYAESAEPFAAEGYTAIRSGRAGQVYYQLLQPIE
jgi:16S rRNA (guanine966-N2)-methyltransferase